MKIVDFDRPAFMKLKAAYKKALVNKEKQFTLDGNKYLVSYAKYLIEYLEMRFAAVRQSHGRLR